MSTPAASPTLASAGHPAALARALDAVQTALFSAAMLLSAFLLFLVQPMAAKLYLPSLGGSPAVWNTCMLFFQAALLAGYAYAHASSRAFGPRWQPASHMLVLLAPLAMLPLAFGSTPTPPAGAHPSGWLLAELAAAVGAPFLVLSTTAPLLQRWFASTRHARAADPYFLYVASNVGSLAALLAYPVLVEPAFALDAQAQHWSSAYALLMLLLAACMAITWLQLTPPSASCPRAPLPCEQRPAQPRSAAAQRASWVLLSAVPSSLMIGVTTHLTTDVAAAPLLWVAPLALYMLTFIVGFSPRTGGALRAAAAALPYGAVVLGALLFVQLDGVARWLLVVLHLVVFFIAALACHGRLAAMRPNSARLTEFYLWLSFGGVVGGAFNALAAPVLFSAVAEYPLALALACLAAPAARPFASGLSPAGRLRATLGPAAALSAAAAAAALGLGALGGVATPFVFVAAVCMPLLLCFALKDNPLRFATALAGVLLANTFAGGAFAENGRVLHACRNFFGVKRVVVDAVRGQHTLVHGVTVHGRQSLRPDARAEPLAYYHRTGPLGDVFDVLLPQTPRCVEIIGLGVGATAAYCRPEDVFTFFEIDDDVARIAADPLMFTYLSGARGRCDVRVGDGRLLLAERPDGGADAVIVDAFSSDAIPTHLITQEAMALYARKIRADGLIAMHISNKYLELKPLVAALARGAGLDAWVRTDRSITLEDAAAGKTPSEWVVLARPAAALNPRTTALNPPATAPTPPATALPPRTTALNPPATWRRLDASASTPAWTDHYSNLLGVLKWQ